MRARSLLAVTVALSLIAVATAASAAEIYKWVDSQGKSHFSDKPPAADQGNPHVETLHGISKRIQESIRAQARDGISIDSISGEGRQCVISGESASHVLTVAFVKRLKNEGVGELTNPLPEADSANPGSEKFELHLLLSEDLINRSKTQR